MLWGNASGPTISSVLSSVLLEILHEKGFGVEFCSTISKLPRGRFLQRVVQQWGDSMEVIGGDKEYLYCIEFVWKRGKWITANAPLKFDLVAITEENNCVSLIDYHVAHLQRS